MRHGSFWGECSAIQPGPGGPEPPSLAPERRFWRLSVAKAARNPSSSEVHRIYWSIRLPGGAILRIDPRPLIQLIPQFGCQLWRRSHVVQRDS